MECISLFHITKLDQGENKPVQCKIFTKHASFSNVFSCISSNIRQLPSFPIRKPEKKTFLFFFTKFNISFSSGGHKQKEVKTILLRNNMFEI
jgi:hypothetical protein